LCIFNKAQLFCCPPQHNFIKHSPNLFILTLRELRLAAGKRLLDKAIVPKPLLLNSRTKILFIRYDGKIGDFFVSSFVYRELKRTYPGITLHMVINEKLAPIVKNNPFIDEYFVMKGRSYYEIIQTAKKLKQQQYDILVDLTPGLRNRDLLFIRLAGAAINVGYNKADYAIFNEFITPIKGHTSLLYRQLLEKLGVTNINAAYDIGEDPMAEKSIQAFFTGHNIQKAVAINFFGASRSRNFNEEKALAITKLVMQQYPGYSIILLTFPQVVDFTKRIIAQCSNPQVIHFGDTKSIYDTIAILKRVQLLISPDTAVVHIAGHFNIPMIAFYSDEEVNFTLWRPLTGAPVLRYSENVNNIDMHAFELQLKNMAYNMQ